MDKDAYMKENVIETNLRIQVEKLGGRCLKWVSPGNNGVPDRIILMPNSKIYFVECKAPGKTLEKLQPWWKKTIEALGFIHKTIDTLEKVKEFIHDLQSAQLSS